MRLMSDDERTRLEDQIAKTLNVGEIGETLAGIIIEVVERVVAIALNEPNPHPEHDLPDRHSEPSSEIGPDEATTDV